MRTRLINFTIPIQLLRDIDLLARKQEKSRSEVLREASRSLVDSVKKREKDFATIKACAKRINMKEDEAVLFIDKIREKLPINQ